jgi:hypothetical protein
MILADNETRVDLPNIEAIAATIIKLLRDERSQPVTAGVHGQCVRESRASSKSSTRVFLIASTRCV